MGCEKDIISEQEFNLQVAHRKTIALPEDDSPGDSELDTGEEFEMGLEFTSNSALIDEEADELPAFDKPHSAR